jgi:hypothetical protein
MEGDCGLMNAVHFTISNLVILPILYHDNAQQNAKENLRTSKLNVIRSKTFYSLKNMNSHNCSV